MASKSTISFLRSLQQKKFRNEEGLFLVEGPKMVSEVLKSDFKVRQLYATSNWAPDQHTSLPLEILSDCRDGAGERTSIP